MDNKLLVLSVCTKDQPNLFFWEYSLKKNNYDYYVLGYNDKWKGWTYRTQLYINKLKELDPNTIVICCDANDLYFILDSTILLNRFLDWETNNYIKKIIVGAEPVCCTGDYFSNMTKNMKAFDICSKYTTNRYRFPNGGFVLGRAVYMEKFYEKLIKNNDDQAEMLDMYIKDKNSFYLDSENIFCGNIPANNKNIAIYEERDLYNMNDGGKGLEIEFTNNWEIIDNKIRNRNNKIEPCVIHFPGITWHKKWNIYIEIFNILNNTNFSIDKKLYSENFLHINVKAYINNFVDNTEKYRWYILGIILSLCVITICIKKF